MAEAAAIMPPADSGAIAATQPGCHAVPRAGPGCGRPPAQQVAAGLERGYEVCVAADTTAGEGLMAQHSPTFGMLLQGASAQPAPRPGAQPVAAREP